MRTLAKRNNSFVNSPSIFDDWFDTAWFNNDWLPEPNREYSMPAVNVHEDEDAFEVELAAPGMKKDDFKVEVENNQLIISSEKKEEKKDQEGNYTRKEFNYQSFCRTFSLPENAVDGDKIKASYKDGILNISIPKKEEARPKPKKSIKIL
jgi:HSP20 family protein